MNRIVLGTFDFPTRDGQRRFYEIVAREMAGWKRLRIVAEDPDWKQRTDRQNRWYWSCFCTPYARWLSEQWGWTVQPDVAHDEFKESFLRVPVVNPDGEQIYMGNGDPFMRTRSTTELNTRDWNIYLDRCGERILERAGLMVPAPSIYHEPERTRKELVAW